MCRNHIQKYIDRSKNVQMTRHVNRRKSFARSFWLSWNARRRFNWQWTKDGIRKPNSKKLDGVSAILNVHSYRYFYQKSDDIGCVLILFSGPDCFPDVRNKIKGAKIKCTGMGDTHCRPKHLFTNHIEKVIIVSHPHHPIGPWVPNRHQAKCLRRWDGVLGGREGDWETAWRVFLWTWTCQAYQGWLSNVIIIFSKTLSEQGSILSMIGLITWKCMKFVAIYQKSLNPSGGWWPDFGTWWFFRWLGRRWEKE